MENFKLEVNNRIEVMFEKKNYKSLVMDIDDDYILINLPVNDGEYLMLHSGEEVEVNTYSNDGNCFNFFAKVITKGRDRNILYYKLSSPYNVKKIQRRNYFRVGTISNVEYKNITGLNDFDEINEIPYQNALMVDLSGGGIKIKIKENVKAKDILLVKLITKSKVMELKGEIVRYEDTEDREKLCGVKFLDITQIQTDLIIEEVFNIARKQRAREKSDF